VIAEEMVAVEKAIAQARAKTVGKTAMLFVGGSRAHHYQELFTELGMETLVAGYEFGHRDDYEGRRVLPNIKIDADSRNIEEITVYPDPTRYKPRKTEEELAQLKEAFDIEFNDYKGIMKDMKKGTLVVDDLSHHEMEKLIEKYKPDVFCAGIKEKYVVQKMGIPMKQLHNYDNGGPYAAFEGAINFYKDIEMIACSTIFKQMKAPWENEAFVTAEYVYS
jgi:nitrogenase molybdenum-iron protein alpha chain